MRSIGYSRVGRIDLCCIAEKTGSEGELPPVFRKQRSPHVHDHLRRCCPRRGPNAAPARKRKGLFARFMAARQRQADQELRRHGLRLPRELEEAGLKISARNEDSLPFVR